MIPRGLPTGRRPTPSELGIEVTIAIVAITHPDQAFVCVSDRAVSFDDLNPAADNMLMKQSSLTTNWSFAYSTNDVKYVYPIIESVQSKLYPKITSFSADNIKSAFSETYSEIASRELMDRHLRKLWLSLCDRIS